MLASVQQNGELSNEAGPTNLSDLLRSEGLNEQDVAEILDLVEFKKVRARRSS